VTTAVDGHRSRRETVRAALCDALLRLLEETPFKDIAVDDVAAAGGIKRSAFYFYFADKRELLMTAAAEAAEALYAEADGWWRGQGPPERRFEAALGGIATLYERHSALLRAATEVSTYDDELRVFWRSLVERFIEATAKHLADEQRAGRVPRSLDARATAESLAWMVERSCYVYLGRGERTAAELVESLSGVWAAALYPGTRPARPRPI
jgi:AcrR family transcriptional regulator